MNYGGKAVRGGQLFGEETKIAMTKKYFKGLQGVENIYTQHKPYMIDLLQVRCFVFFCRIAQLNRSMLITKIKLLFCYVGSMWNSRKVWFSLRSARRV